MDRQQLFAYHQWATQKILEHIEEAAQEDYSRSGTNSFSSMYETIAHTIGVEKLWFKRMNGVQKPAFEEFNVETAQKAKEAFLLLHAEMELYFASLTEETWQEQLPYYNTKGDAFRHSREEMLFTLINHGSYHRGQLTSFLRQFGHSGIAIDYIYFPQENR